MDIDLELLSSRLTVNKNQIDGYEGQSRLGRRVDQTAHELAIDNHNSTVKRYNWLVAARKVKYAEYSRDIESVNDMVRRFNSGER